MLRLFITVFMVAFLIAFAVGSFIAISSTRVIQ